MGWHKIEITFELNDEEDDTASDIEAQCYQIVKDYANDVGIDLVYNINEEEKLM